MVDFSVLSKLVGRKFDAVVRAQLLSLLDGYKFVLDEDEHMIRVKGMGLYLGLINNVVSTVQIFSKLCLNYKEQYEISDQGYYLGSLISGLEFGANVETLDTVLGKPIFVRSVSPSLQPPENASNEEFSSYIKLLETRKGEVEQRYYKFPSSESLLLMCELNQGSFLSVVIRLNNDLLKAEACEYSGKFEDAVKIYLTMNDNPHICFDLIRCYRNLGNVVEERRCLQEALKQILYRKKREAYEQRLAEIEVD